MEYKDRLKEYEKEKAALRDRGVSSREYEREIKKLADKWEI